jgi:hypothetical protein
MGASVVGFSFPMSAMSRDFGDRRASRAMALCLCTLSQTPTPHRRFVENKSKSAIRPDGHRAVEATFLSFLPA